MEEKNNNNKKNQRRRLEKRMLWLKCVKQVCDLPHAIGKTCFKNEDFVVQVGGQNEDDSIN